MTRILTTIILLMLTSIAFCTEREIIRDATGKVVGTATTDGNRTIYRDATGKTTGTATKDGNRTIYRDATGKTVGTATESGNRTTYRDATGKTSGIPQETAQSTATPPVKQLEQRNELEHVFSKYMFQNSKNT